MKKDAQKKRKLFTDTYEFTQQIYPRESKKIEQLRKNPVFRKRWRDVFVSDKNNPEERRKEMLAKRQALCKDYGLHVFPYKLDKKHFIPVIGANLTKIDGKLMWDLSNLTSIEEKHRLLPEVQQYQDAFYGKPNYNKRRHLIRDKELYDLYYDNSWKRALTTISTVV